MMLGLVCAVAMSSATAAIRITTSGLIFIWAVHVFHTVNFHGLRYSRDRYLDAVPSPSIFSMLAFHAIRRPERSATFPSKHVVVERCPISMSEVGLCRDFTQSRKLRTCASPCLFSFLTRRASTFLPPSGVISKYSRLM